jgi:hypothetical protein
MPINVWSAARDEMLDTLAKRDADERLREDRARRDRIDVEERERQSTLDRENREYRDAQIALGNRTLDTNAADKTADNERADAAAKAAADAIAAKQLRITNLMKIVTDAKAPMEMRQQAAGELDALQVDPSMLKEFLNPTPKTKPVMRIGRDGKMVKIGDAEAGAHFVNEPAPHADPNAPKPFRDDPKLPNGTKAWIESIAARGVPIEAARAELSGGWPGQRQSHPNADLALGAKYLDALYPKSGDAVTGQVQRPLGAAAPAQPAPVDPRTNRGGGEAPPPPPPAPTAAVPPGDRPASSSDADIAAYLTSKGKAVTPETIAIVRQRMAQ